MLRSRAALLVVPVALAALLAAGCGGGGGGSATTSESTTTTTATTTETETATPAAEWANGFCGAFKDWANALKPIGQSLQSNPTKDNLQSAVNDIKNANDTLANDLKGLGRPDISGADEVNTAVNTLADEIGTDSDTITNALSNLSTTTELVAAATAVSTTLLTLQTQVKDTLTQLKAINASQSGSLKDAFNNASNCTSLSS